MKDRTLSTFRMPSPIYQDAVNLTVYISIRLCINEFVDVAISKRLTPDN
jgi:hypothetical protein